MSHLETKRLLVRDAKYPITDLVFIQETKEKMIFSQIESDLHSVRRGILYSIHKETKLMTKWLRRCSTSSWMEDTAIQVIGSYISRSDKIT
jgi:hypothetical protein